MGERRAAFIVLLFCFCLLGSMSGIAFASSENWVEVARFTGSDNFTTDYFICDHVEWRIRWEFDPGHGHFPQLHKFSVTTYSKGEVSYLVDLINETPGGIKNGTRYIHNNAGEFYMKIDTGIIENYTIIVEQNTDSNSEDPFVSASGNWIEVARFTGLGTGIIRNNEFTCDHVEWRIKWEFVPAPIEDAPTEYTTQSLCIPTYEKAGGDQPIGFASSGIGGERNNGTSYFHYKKGTFYITIRYWNVESYTIIIEQDLNYIPEFPSWIILPLFTVVTLCAIMVKKKLRWN